MSPQIGVVDYNLALSETKFPKNSPAAPQVTTKTKTRLNPIHLNKIINTAQCKIQK
jgi:hypothetical protein